MALQPGKHGRHGPDLLAVGQPADCVLLLPSIGRKLQGHRSLPSCAFPPLTQQRWRCGQGAEISKEKERWEVGELSDAMPELLAMAGPAIGTLSQQMANGARL